jgi:hypothetical protein
VSQHLAEAFVKNADKKSFCNVVPESLHNFREVFMKESFDTLLERRKWDHMIELERKEELPTTWKVYPMSPEAGCLPRGSTFDQLHPAIEVTNRHAGLLCQKEGQ